MNEMCAVLLNLACCEGQPIRGRHQSMELGEGKIIPHSKKKKKTTTTYYEIIFVGF
jgi:hypothetical protein